MIIINENFLLINIDFIEMKSISTVKWEQLID